MVKQYGSSCLYSYECNSALGLSCPLTINTCNCPLNSSSIFCDCTRDFNNEYYWNGISCQPAVSFNKSCSNVSTSYMCQTLTQGTFCVSSGFGYKCQCSSLQYFDTTQNMCMDKMTYNETCNYNDMCLSTLGLICNAGLCE